MKRNLLCILIVLFILAACVPSPKGLDQAATATQISNENASPWLTFPAPVPTEEGEKVEIFSADYPATPNDFILADTRTNQEKTELIKSWAPDEYEKEVALYKAEMERTGQSAGDFEFEASIVDGKSWVVVPKNKKTEKMYVPKIGELIQCSLHLWGYLDRSLDDDFFDLVEVGIDNPKLLGDKSGWHVIAQVENGQRVRKWYDAPHDQIREVAPEPTPTPEVAYKINANLPVMSYDEMAEKVDEVAKDFSTINFGDFSSGKLLEWEQKYIAENPPFNEEVKNNDIIKNMEHSEGGGSSFEKNTVYILSEEGNFENPNTRPIKIITYYVFKDQAFFESMGIDPIEITSSKKWPFWMATWAYHNPDGTVTLGHSLIDIFAHSQNIDKIKNRGDFPEGSDPRPVPIYKYFNLKIKEGMLKKKLNLATYNIYQTYPEYQPNEEMINLWIKSGQMPIELEANLFGLSTYPIYWK
jgi:hypothetical protein